MNYHPTVREPRQGIMLHYDDSASDAGALAWLRSDPRCHVSYNWLVLDDGQVEEIAPLTARPWHAGVCRPSSRRLVYRDANSAFYGIAAATRAGIPVTTAQLGGIVRLCLLLWKRHLWGPEDGHRLVGHASEAWPRGRKIDPVGPDPAHPVLSPEAVWATLRPSLATSSS